MDAYEHVSFMDNAVRYVTISKDFERIHDGTVRRCGQWIWRRRYLGADRWTGITPEEDTVDDTLRGWASRCYEGFKRDTFDNPKAYFRTKTLLSGNIDDMCEWRTLRFATYHRVGRPNTLLVPVCDKEVWRFPSLRQNEAYVAYMHASKMDTPRHSTHAFQSAQSFWTLGNLETSKTFGAFKTFASSNPDIPGNPGNPGNPGSPVVNSKS